MRGGAQHDPSSDRCYCWGCANARLIGEHWTARDRARIEARERTKDLTISIVSESDRKFIYQFELNGYWVSGTLRELLSHNYGDQQFVVAAFQALEGDQVLDALAAARRKRQVRIADLWAKWDEEYADERRKVGVK